MFTLKSKVKKKLQNLKEKKKENLIYQLLAGSI